jgi:DNA excision repair protein ERCC-4
MHAGMNSRKMGMQIKKTLESELTKEIIAIDCREFSSLTPIFLNEKGFQLIPLSLTVGDYILTDEICIEKKSF